MKKVLPPITHRDAYTRAVQQPIVEYFREAIFGPLLGIVRDAGIHPDPADQAIQNAPSEVLERAIRSGRLYYTDGVFSGSFSAEISRELKRLGATWDPVEKIFRLPIDRVPIELRGLLAQSSEAAASVHKRILDTLADMQQGIAAAPTGISFTRALDVISGDLEKQFVRTVSGIEDITIEADITPGMRAALTRDFTENLDLYIKDFAGSRIPELRRLVEQNVFQGGRADRLAALIEAQFGVSVRKAKFLAGQETSLLVAKYREQRYRAIGSTHYRWNTSHDEAVRPDHRVLNGKIFSWDIPPVTCRATQARNNPGEDFNCRCVALPVIETDIASILP